MIDGPVASGQLGLTCAACHTGQLEICEAGSEPTRCTWSGAKPKAQDGIRDPAKAGDLLAPAVVGTLLAEAFIPPVPSPVKLTQSGVFRALRKDFAEHLPGENLDTLHDPRLSPNAKIDALVALKAFVDARLSDMFQSSADR